MGEGMSAEESPTADLLEIVIGLAQMAGRKDWDAILDYYASDAVWQTPWWGSFEGHAALRGLWEDFTGIYRDWEIDTDEVRDLGDEVVLSVFTMRGRLADGGGEIRERGAWVYQWEASKIVRVLDFRDIDEARVAAERLAGDRE